MSKQPRFCGWTENDDGAWEADCGLIWEFTDGGPAENHVFYCPKCGKRVSVRRAE